jgi:hypothetical protein
MSERVRSNKHSASPFFMPMNQHATIRAPSLNIYPCWFEFYPQLSTVPFLFLLYPQITEISTLGASKVRCDLLTADINYADQDDLLLMHPMHRHLFSRLTCPLHSAFLRIAMDNRRTRGVNITTLPSEILEIVAAKVSKMSPTTLSLRRS